MEGIAVHAACIGARGPRQQAAAQMFCLESQTQPGTQGQPLRSGRLPGTHHPLRPPPTLAASASASSLLTTSSSRTDTSSLVSCDVSSAPPRLRPASLTWCHSPYTLALPPHPGGDRAASAAPPLAPGERLPLVASETRISCCCWGLPPAAASACLLPAGGTAGCRAGPSAMLGMVLSSAARSGPGCAVCGTGPMTELAGRTAAMRGDSPCCSSQMSAASPAHAGRLGGALTLQAHSQQVLCPGLGPPPMQLPCLPRCLPGHLPALSPGRWQRAPVRLGVCCTRHCDIVRVWRWPEGPTMVTEAVVSSMIVIIPAPPPLPAAGPARRGPGLRLGSSTR